MKTKNKKTPSLSSCFSSVLLRWTDPEASVSPLWGSNHGAVTCFLISTTCQRDKTLPMCPAHYMIMAMSIPLRMYFY